MASPTQRLRDVRDVLDRPNPCPHTALARVRAVLANGAAMQINDDPVVDWNDDEEYSR